MNTDLLQHLINVIERRGFAAALDAIEPARSGTGARQPPETNVDRLVDQAPMEDEVETTVAGEPFATPFRRGSR